MNKLAGIELYNSFYLDGPDKLSLVKDGLGGINLYKGTSLAGRAVKNAAEVLSIAELESLFPISTRVRLHTAIGKYAVVSLKMKMTVKVAHALNRLLCRLKGGKKRAAFTYDFAFLNCVKGSVKEGEVVLPKRIECRIKGMRINND